MATIEFTDPTIGKIVFYTNLGDKDDIYPPEQHAAIITKVRKHGKVCIHIFYPTGQFDRDDVPFSAEYQRGHWSWPRHELK